MKTILCQVELAPTPTLVPTSTSFIRGASFCGHINPKKLLDLNSEALLLTQRRIFVIFFEKIYNGF
jgi:hypothetical protein